MSDVATSDQAAGEDKTELKRVMGPKLCSSSSWETSSARGSTR